MATPERDTGVLETFKRLVQKLSKDLETANKAIQHQASVISKAQASLNKTQVELKRKDDVLVEAQADALEDHKQLTLLDTGAPVP